MDPLLFRASGSRHDQEPSASFSDFTFSIPLALFSVDLDTPVPSASLNTCVAAIGCSESSPSKNSTAWPRADFSSGVSGTCVRSLALRVLSPFHSTFAAPFSAVVTA